MGLTKAHGKYGPVKITIENPSAGQAAFLIISGFIVSGLIAVGVIALLVHNLLIAYTGDASGWNFLWIILTTMYLINVAADS